MQDTERSISETESSRLTAQQSAFKNANKWCKAWRAALAQPGQHWLDVVGAAQATVSSSRQAERGKPSRPCLLHATVQTRSTWLGTGSRRGMSEPLWLSSPPVPVLQALNVYVALVAVPTLGSPTAAGLPGHSGVQQALPAPGVSPQ